MKAETQRIYAVHSTDGYTTSKNALAYYPIRAAAEGSPEAANLRGYSHICNVDVIKFDELIYVFSKEINKQSVLGNCPAYTVVACYQDSSYVNGFDKTRYYIGNEEVLKILNDGGNHSLRKMFLIKDGEDNYYLLSKQEPITINKFIMSHQLAVAHAKSKLTEEEQKLLGL